ncbi:MAG: HD domain-containing protein [Lachnospiraceae bacterium]|nr:HD domain-containing protein [Lachnospiraceae bacterium]
MKYLKDYKEGDRVLDVYLCKHKQSAVTKNGKSYDNLILQDKTGVMDAKIWDPNSAGIAEFDALDYIEVYGEITSFNGILQVNVKRVRKVFEGEYIPSDYLPMTKKDIEEMFKELKGYMSSLQNIYLKKLLHAFFVEDEEFVKKFKYSSAAKAVHHGFVGGLLEHTLSVTKMCDYYTSVYPILNRDLLLAAAIRHDIGKTKELSSFPENDYTDEGQFLGHIVMGTEMVGEKIRKIDGFPKVLENELKHCIISHHGEFEFGSPKKPAIVEAIALNFADNTDAKIQSFTELMENRNESGWTGFNRLFDSNVIETRME